MTIKAKASIEDLYRVPEHGKAEIVHGELVTMCPTGSRPARAEIRIAASLLQHEETCGGGFAFGDNTGFLINLPHRKSVSPDAAWYVGDVTGMKFLQGAPAFAVEVRSENDYGPAEEEAIRGKIADYFAVGAQVVWDVDLLGEAVITKYRADNPEAPIIFRRGEIADAEPAVPGWTIPVDRLFA
jgi:Uma2 family endonuclease